MISAYMSSNGFKPVLIDSSNLDLLNQAIWVDLLSPSPEEEQWVENALALGVPTQEEMREIEFSSRLYIESNILYMTAVMVAGAETLNPLYDAVTFALASEQLLTVRYIAPQSFKLASSVLGKSNGQTHSPVDILFILLEAAVDRLADVLEFVGNHLDNYANTIFPPETNHIKPNYQQVMKNISLKSGLNNKARESLVTFTRLITFFTKHSGENLSKENHIRINTLVSDLSSLSDYAGFISNKVNFLLDGTLGMINIEQNDIIKIFSVAAVIFLPPTLIASIYGMNFKFMPELSYKGGYFFALSMMVLSAWLPYRYFKYRRWL